MERLVGEISRSNPCRGASAGSLLTDATSKAGPTSLGCAEIQPHTNHRATTSLILLPPPDLNDGAAKINVQTGVTRLCAPALLLQPLGQEHLQQGLIGYVPLVRQDFQVLDHGNRQSQRNRPQCGLQVRKLAALGGLPIDELRRI